MENLLFVASKLLWPLLRPSSLALLLAWIGLSFVWRGRRAGRWFLLPGLLYFAAAALLPLSHWAIAPLEDRFPRPTPPAEITGIVVLGGAVDQRLTAAHGIPAMNGAAERMTELVALARRYPAARLVFTGGQGSLLPGALDEAAVARQLWTAMGLPPERVTYEAASRNTFENAVFARRLVQPGAGETWLLVTSAGHMPRAMGSFRRAGWPMLPWPVNFTTGDDPAIWFDAPFPDRLARLEWALHEWAGLVAYRLLGRTEAWFPRIETVQ